MFTKNPIFRHTFALPVGNPESDDLYINVYDAGIEQDDTNQKPLGNLKIIVSSLLRRSKVRYVFTEHSTWFVSRNNHIALYPTIKNYFFQSS